jgi:NitT/TauT family transport system permease protein
VDLYTDMRVLLGWAWTYLIVAEMVGTTSGITYFINQQARYRNYENVYAAIMLIGLIGLLSDLALARLGRALFPWRQESRRLGLVSAVRGLLTARTRRAAAATEAEELAA